MESEPETSFRVRRGPAPAARFTLMEVVIAVAILGMGLAAALSLVSEANARAYKGIEKWRRQHILRQAAEFYLLQGADASPDADIFPYSDYTPSCDIQEPEGMPAEFDAPPSMSGWTLRTYHIAVRSKEGDAVAEVFVDKIVKEEP